MRVSGRAVAFGEIGLLETERRWEDLAAALVSDAATAPEGERAGIFSRPVVSNYAFWFAVGAYIMLAGTR